jgi:DNA-binding SARP family transcriptional activator
VLDFRILGPLEVVADGTSLRLGGPKQRATLAIMLLSANRVVPVERLADDLYAGAAPVTAVTQVQRQVSELRKLLREPVIETRTPGYTIHVSPDQLDLSRFERRVEEATELLARGEAQRASDLLRDALMLWRGPALADLAYESFAQTAIERLEEIRLAALAQRIEADLALARHRDVVAELQQLSDEHPTQEAFRAQLMLALYRSGRQAEALDVYRTTRATLIDEFGIEPSLRLRELERAILVQEPALDVGAAFDSERAALLFSSDDGELDDLLAIAEPLAGAQERELILARLLADERTLSDAAAALNERCASLPTRARTAVFTTDDVARDAVRFARSYDADLVLLGLSHTDGVLRDDVAAIVDGSPADVALVGGRVDFAAGEGVFVPFAGNEHDWAALELGAWLASGMDAPLRLVGTTADPRRERRDASRLLADASLSVQRVVGVKSEPRLAAPTEDALVAAVASATVVVVGISPRWRAEGIGAIRHALIERAQPPAILVHRGPRPGGLAPRASRTRFTWSIEN